MKYVLNTVSQIINNMDDNNILKQYLSNYDNKTYKLVKYDKSLLTIDNLCKEGLIRSIVLNSNNNIVSFSPPKSLPYDTFINLQQSSIDATMTINEFIDGTMVNLFFDPIHESWEIATKSVVGGKNAFYNNLQTFKLMFYDALQESNLNINVLSKHFCYSFVLQHPKNRIVFQIDNPTLYLIGMYNINNTDLNNIIITSYDINNTNIISKLCETDDLFDIDIDVEYYNMLNYFHNKTNVKFPKIFNTNELNQMINKHVKYDNLMGMMIYDKNGNRTKIRNIKYEHIRKLRGNNPNMNYHFLTCIKQGTINSFLNIYPEYNSEYDLLKLNLDVFSVALYNNYVSCYIHKTQPLIQYNSKYRTHMFSVHSIYLTELKPNKKNMSQKKINEYLYKLDTPLLYASLFNN
jgi:hypothetical protein